MAQHHDFGVLRRLVVARRTAQTATLPHHSQGAKPQLTAPARSPGAVQAGPFHARARGAAIRRQLISVAARIARHGRGPITIHLPDGWHRAHDWMNLLGAACGPPGAPA